MNTNTVKIDEFEGGLFTRYGGYESGRLNRNNWFYLLMKMVAPKFRKFKDGIGARGEGLPGVRIEFKDDISLKVVGHLLDFIMGILTSRWISWAYNIVLFPLGFRGGDLKGSWNSLRRGGLVFCHALYWKIFVAFSLGSVFWYIFGVELGTIFAIAVVVSIVQGYNILKFSWSRDKKEYITYMIISIMLLPWFIDALNGEINVIIQVVLGLYYGIGVWYWNNRIFGKPWQTRTEWA